MATEVTNYKCLNCTGPLHFHGETGQLKCDYCDASYEVDLIEEIYAEKEREAISAGARPQWDMSMAGEDWSDEETAHLRVYSCPSCGAELIMDDTTAATSCPYCNNPTVVPGQFAGQLKPDYVIPFKLDKNAAINALKTYYKGKKFLPKSFTSGNHIEEIKGVYVPFWLFDGKADASMRFLGTIVHTRRSGDEEITSTEYFRVIREGNIAFEKIPVDGSSKMPDEHMDAVEPFDYSDLKAFSTAYLPGYMADKYDMDIEACKDRANSRIEKSTEEIFSSTTTGYTTLVPEYSEINLTQGEVKYALMPVWMLSTKWNGENFLFAMNGQTGKLIGDLPIDKGLYWSWFAKISLPLMAILGYIMFIGGRF
ncbi:MAG: hypothetical protein ACOX0L_06575 [Natronincolaceae bacterium]|jgi:DNA-directed RNA polymerase subunit RPC12/RpoP